MPKPGQPAQAGLDKVQSKFEETLEFKQWQQLVTALKKESHTSDSIVQLPAGFLRLALGQVQEDPFIFPVMRRPWNRAVEALDLPRRLKKGTPDAYAPDADKRPVSDAEMNTLYQRFETSEEYRLWQGFIQAVGDASASPVTIPTGFVRIAAVEFEQRPFRFFALRQAWDRTVDELDLPKNLKRDYLGE